MISVAMTTYNGEKYIVEQLDSILNQTVPVDEVIIFDDKSTDLTLNILKQYQDDRIKVYVNNENVGYIENFYRAINNCNGDYIFLADQDDVWESNKVELCMNVMDDENTMLVTSGFKLIDSKGEELSNKDFSKNRFLKKVEKAKEDILDIDFYYLILGNVLQGATFCFNKKVQKIYKEIHNLDVYHDHQLILIAAKFGKVKFINNELIKYRIHENNTIGMVKKKSGAFKKLLRVPKKKPSLVKFLDEINKISIIRNYSYYKIIIYCRIPSFINYLKTII